jgi:hypothetical protein
MAQDVSPGGWAGSGACGLLAAVLVPYPRPLPALSHFLFNSITPIRSQGPETNGSREVLTIALKYHLGDTLSKKDLFCHEMSGIIYQTREMAKQIFLFRRFAHRRNADASFDGICLACFLTVGSAWVDVALQT